METIFLYFLSLLLLPLLHLPCPSSAMMSSIREAIGGKHKTVSVRSTSVLLQQAFTYGLESHDVHFEHYDELTRKIYQHANQVATYENAPDFDGLKCQEHETAENALLMAVAYEDVLLTIYLPLVALKKYYQGDYERYQKHLPEYKSREALVIQKRVPFAALDDHFNHMHTFLTNFKALESYMDELRASIKAIENDWQALQRAERGRITLADYFIDMKSRKQSEYTHHFLRLFKERHQRYVANARNKIRHYGDPNATLNSIRPTSGGSGRSVGCGSFSRQSSTASEFERLPQIHLHDIGGGGSSTSGPSLSRSGSIRRDQQTPPTKSGSIRGDQQIPPTKSGSIRGDQQTPPTKSGSIRGDQQTPPTKSGSIRGDQSTPSRSGSIRDEVPTKFGSIRDEVPTKSGSIRDEVPTKTGSIRDEVPTKSGSIRDEVPTKSGSIQDEIPTKTGSIRDEVPTKTGSIRDEVPTKTGSIRDEVPTKTGSIRDEVPTKSGSIRMEAIHLTKSPSGSIRSTDSSIRGDLDGWDSDWVEEAEHGRRTPSRSGSNRQKPFIVPENACIIQYDESLQIKLGDIIWEIDTDENRRIWHKNGTDPMVEVTQDYNPITQDFLLYWLEKIPESGKTKWTQPSGAEKEIGSDYVKFTQGHIMWELTDVLDIWFKNGYNGAINVRENYEPLTLEFLRQLGFKG